MPQNIPTVLSEKDVMEIDKLIEQGVFLNRSDAIRTGLRYLLEISKKELQDMEKIKQVRAEVNEHLTIHVGDILSAGLPIKVVVEGKEFYRVPVRGVYNNIPHTYGYIFLDANTLELDKKLSDSPQQIHKNAEKIVKS